MQNEQTRLEKRLLTIDTVQQMVDETDGDVKVLCIVGRTASGKTWALTGWAGQSQGLRAYVDCSGMVRDCMTTVHLGGVSEDVVNLPDFISAMQGVNVVIVDEPQMNIKLVQALYEDTEMQTQRLLVLPLQDAGWLDRFQIPKKNIRCYSIAGLPLAL